MDRINSPFPGCTVAERAFNAWPVALAVTSMLLLAPAVSADELICDVSRDGRLHRYLIKIDDRQTTVTVVDADEANQQYPVNVRELGPERVQFACNSIRMDPTKFVRQGKVVTMSVTTNDVVVLDRSANTWTEIGFVTDDKDEVLSLENLRAMHAEEEAWVLRKKSGPSHDPMFWLFLEVATYRYDGSCRVAPPHPSD